MLHILSCLLLSLYLIVFGSSQIIEFPFTITRRTFNTTQSLFNNYLIGEVCVGTPMKCLKVGFSMSTYYTWLCQKETLDCLYDNSSSSTFQYHPKEKVWNYDTQEKSGVGRMVNDTFYFNKNKDFVKTINFLHPKERSCMNIEVDGEIGFNSHDILHYADKGYSLLDQLHLGSVKYPNALSVKYNNAYSGMITFGVDDFPSIDSINTINKNVSTLKTSPMSGKHLMNLMDYVEFKGIKYEVNEYTVIHFEAKATVLPKVTYEKFKTDIISQLLPNDLCYEYQDDVNYLYYLCDAKIKDIKMESLMVYFDKNEEIEINLNEQFMSFGEEGKMLFGIIGTRSFHNQIQLGDLIFRRYYVMFERNNHTISLMRNEKYDISDTNDDSGSVGEKGEMPMIKKVMIKLMQFFFISILICVIIYMFVLYRNKRRSLGENYKMITDVVLPKNKTNNIDLDLK